MVILTTPLITAIAVLSAVTSAAPSYKKRGYSTSEPASYGSNSYGSSNNYGSSDNYGSSNGYNSGSSDNSWNSGSDNNYGSSSDNSWDQSSSDNNYQGNSWDSSSSDTWSSSVDTWTSTSTADNSWQTTTYAADNSWETTTTSADNSWETTTSSADDSWQTTSQTAWVATTTVAAAATQTWSSSSGSYGSSGNSYGSGSSNWGTDYNNCVSQCQANWNMLPPPSTTTAPPSYNGGSGSSGSDSWNSGGTPTTHTVIVAPTQGVLRYIPLAINASVGDTISWQWHAGPHTVTKSSEATICNKTLDNPFASGQQNASFVFNQLINDTSPIFYYCGVPGHCEKGMFGIVNAPTTFSIDTSLEAGILAQAAASPTMAALVTMVNNMTANTSAYNWGSQLDMSVVPADYQQAFIENALYSRLFYGANPGALESGMGAYSANGTLVFPQDLPVLMAAANVANGTSSSTTSSAPAGSSPSSGASSGAYGSMSSSGASHRIAYSGGFLAVAAVVVGAVLA